MDKCLKWPQMGPGGSFPTNPDLADILGDVDFDSETFYFFLVGFPDFQTGPGPGPGLGRAKHADLLARNVSAWDN